MTKNIESLAKILEADEPADTLVLQDVHEVFRDHLAEGALPRVLLAEDLRRTDTIIQLADLIVPGWSIQIRGKALLPNGHWQCTLRRSESLDKDEFIGIGMGASLAMALAAALLRTIGFLSGQGQIG
jgi:hypothetical protein